MAYVNGRVDTNTVEKIWSCLKQTLHGRYIAVRPFRLNAYLDEQVFRFNGREGNDIDRFVAAPKHGWEARDVCHANSFASPWRLRPGRAARAEARRAMIARAD